MKFSETTKWKMRRQRQKRIAGVFRYCWTGCECQSFDFVQSEENGKNYTIISKMVNNDDYYLLLANGDTNEICIVKLVYSGWVKFTKLSVRAILRNKILFKKWLKDINHEAGKCNYMIKYVLTEDGKLEVRNTDYRENHRKAYNYWRAVHKCFEY